MDPPIQIEIPNPLFPGNSHERIYSTQENLLIMLLRLELEFMTLQMTQHLQISSNVGAVQEGPIRNGFTGEAESREAKYWNLIYFFHFDMLNGFVYYVSVSIKYAKPV